MIGTAGLKGLRVSCVVGIYEHERAMRQPIVLDIELDYDFAAAVGSDAIGDAVDYDHVAAAVTELAERRQFQLLETMAEEAATMLLGRSGAVHAVRIEIRKPAAVPAADCAFVRVARARA